MKKKISPENKAKIKKLIVEKGIPALEKAAKSYLEKKAKDASKEG